MTYDCFFPLCFFCFMLLYVCLCVRVVAVLCRRGLFIRDASGIQFNSLNDFWVPTSIFESAFNEITKTLSFSPTTITTTINASLVPYYRRRVAATICGQRLRELEGSIRNSSSIGVHRTAYTSNPSFSSRASSLLLHHGQAGSDSAIGRRYEVPNSHQPVPSPCESRLGGRQTGFCTLGDGCYTSR
jgi:hypothetical protein